MRILAFMQRLIAYAAVWSFYGNVNPVPCIFTDDATSLKLLDFVYVLITFISAQWLIFKISYIIGARKLFLLFPAI